MEHRWSDRIPSSLEVLLFRNNIPVATCKTRNISIYGMFAITGPLKYERNSLLEVEFVFSTQGRKKRYRIPAYVVHQTNEGLGLMFGDETPETISFIKNVIQGIPCADSIGNLPAKNKPSFVNGEIVQVADLR